MLKNISLSTILLWGSVIHEKRYSIYDYQKMGKK